MKKFLLALVALFITLTISAQSYNIVITTSTGTQIALPANEIGSISFNNGKLVIDGTDLSKITTSKSLDSLSREFDMKLEAYMNAELKRMDDLTYRIEDVDKRSYTSLLDSVSALRETIANIKTSLNPDEGDHFQIQSDIKSLYEKVNSLQASINAINNTLASKVDQSDFNSILTDLQTRLVSNDDYITSITAKLQVVDNEVNDLKTQLNTLESRISSAKQK